MSPESDNCILCKIGNATEKGHIVWSNNDYFAILDIHPMATGHVLLVPRKHVPYLFAMEDNEYSKLLLTAKRLAEPLRQAMNSKHVGLAVEGIAIDHVHLHLVPINYGNDLDPNKARIATESELTTTAEKLRQAFSTLL